MGFTKNWTFFRPLKSHRPWDWLMAQTSHTLFNRWVMAAFTRAHHNAATFQGLNYYRRRRFHNGHFLIPAGEPTRAAPAH